MESSSGANRNRRLSVPEELPKKEPSAPKQRRASWSGGHVVSDHQVLSKDRDLHQKIGVHAHARAELGKGLNPLRRDYSSNKYVKRVDLTSADAVNGAIAKLEGRTILTPWNRARRKKALKGLREAQKIHRNLQSNMKQIQGFRSELHQLEAQGFDPSTVAKADEWAAGEATKMEGPPDIDNHQALNRLFCWSEASPGAKELDLDTFSADELIYFVANLEGEELDAARESVKLVDGDADPRDAKVALTGHLDTRKAKAVRALMMKLIPEDKDARFPQSKVVSVAGIDFSETSNQELRSVIRHLAADATPADVAGQRHNLIAVQSNPEILRRLDEADAALMDPEVGAELDAQYAVAGKSDGRLETFRFEKPWAEANKDKESDTEKRGFRFSSDAGPLSSRERTTLDFVTTSGDGVGVPDLNRDDKVRVNANSFTPDPVNLGNFSASANGVIRAGEGHVSSGCEDRMVLSSFDLQIGDQTIPCMVPAVIDGHNGQQAAQFAQEHLSAALEEHLGAISSLDLEKPEDRELVRHAIKTAFLEMATKWEEEADKDSTGLSGNSGADICCPVVLGGYIFTANLGDSRALMITDDGPQFLTPDTEIGHGEYAVTGAMRGHGIVPKDETSHNVKLTEWRVGATGEKPHLTIPTSHSFGDHSQFSTSSVPIVACRKIPPGGCRLAVMCDGFYDIGSGSQLAEYLDPSMDGGLGLKGRNERLHQKAANAGGGDDKTSILVDLRPSS